MPLLELRIRAPDTRTHAWTERGGTMKNKLILMRNSVRLTCIWVPTGDVTRPLACKWVTERSAEADSSGRRKFELEKVHRCA